MHGKSQNFGSSSSQRSVSGRSLLDISAGSRNLVHRENKAWHSVRFPLVAGMRQRGEVHSGGSYLSSNDLRVHFGSAAVAGTAELGRASGKKEKVPPPAVDRICTIEEKGKAYLALCTVQGRAKWAPNLQQNIILGTMARKMNQEPLFGPLNQSDVRLQRRCTCRLAETGQ
jgi:hypothetical protein